MQGRFDQTPDGPWRVGDSFHVIFDTEHLAGQAWAAAVDLASRLDRAGLPVSRFSLTGAPSSPPNRRPEWPFGFPAEASGNAGAALRMAIEAQADCLVVDGTLDLDAAVLWEMRRVAETDPMIAGVSPRFDRDALCTFPDDAPDSNSANPENRWSAGILRTFFPPVTYAPLPDGRCLYLKGSVLTQFRPDIRVGDMDWDRYALWINRYGFRMAVANHAAARLAPGSAAKRYGNAASRSTRLEKAYPGTRNAVASFLSGTPRVVERLLAGLVPNSAGRREVAFDLTHVGSHHSGTAELARALIRRAAASSSGNWEIYVVAPLATYEFHFADAPVPPKRIDPDDLRVFAAFIRIGQPFSWKELDHAVRRAPAIVFFMLDTIGLDCIRLAPDELDALWRFTLAESDGLLFNSAFTQRQFERRFGLRSDLPKRPSLHSLRLEEYGDAPSMQTQGESVLILGNSFAHKYVEEAARLLAAAHPHRSIVALGPSPGAIADVVSYTSGSLDHKAMSDLYRRARIVVYPSVYEGFGFPLLEALAHRRPVLVRALAPFAEILHGLPEAANVHVFDTDAELVRLVGSELGWTDQRRDVTARDWEDCTLDLLQILDEALGGISYQRVLRRVDFMRGRMEWIRSKRFRAAGLADDEGWSDDVERLAGLAGRIAQDIVLKLARVPGSGVVLRLANRVARRAAAR